MRFPGLVLSPVLVAAVFAGLCETAPDPSIVIVGAGASGIAAASKLFQNNFTNVKVLEAESRIGGRIHSVQLSNGYVDLGAEWCHGVEDNVVYELAKDFGALRPERTTLREFYRSNKEEVSPEFVEKWTEVFGKTYYGRHYAGEESTVGNYCTEAIPKAIADTFANETEQKLALQTLHLYEKCTLENDGAFDWFQVSLNGNYKVCKGGDQTWSGHGFKTVLEAILSRIPDDKKKIFNGSVLLNKRVEEIMWNDTGAVVKCSDGSVYNADHVIMTPSLGVLKKEHQRMFKPQLPADKQKVIQLKGFDAVMKIILHFPTNWWPKESVGFTLWWDENAIQTLCAEFPSGCTESGKVWLKDLFLFLTVDGIDNVLIGWVTGPLVPLVEKLPDKTVLEGCIYVLNKFLGHKYNVTDPDRMIRSRWYSNPNFRGTYSYQTVEVRKHRIPPEEELSKPLPDESNPTLLFAGEATHPTHYSAVHGAIESGFREAGRITDLYDSNLI